MSGKKAVFQIVFVLMTIGSWSIARGENKQKIWNISVFAGMSAASGNTDSSAYNGTASVVCKKYPTEFSGRVDMLYGQNDGVSSANRCKLHLNYDRYIL